MKRERIEDPVSAIIKAPKISVTSIRGAGEEDEQAPAGIVIHIQTEWRLLFDGIQFHVQERKTRQDGKRVGTHYWKTHAYICDLGGAIGWFARRKIYMIQGTYDGKAVLEKMFATLDQIEADCKAALVKGKELVA